MLLIGGDLDSAYFNWDKKYNTIQLFDAIVNMLLFTSDTLFIRMFETKYQKQAWHEYTVFGEAFPSMYDVYVSIRSRYRNGRIIKDKHWKLNLKPISNKCLNKTASPSLVWLSSHLTLPPWTPSQSPPVNRQGSWYLHSRWRRRRPGRLPSSRSP